MAVWHKVSFWLERDPQQHVLWSPLLVLSDAYYDVLSERPMPIDLDHLGQLTRRVRAMDIYSWLSYRLPLIRRGKTVRIPMTHLQEIFGRGIASKDKFTQQFKFDLKLISEVYRDFDIELQKGLLVVRNSPPPVAPKNVVSLLN